MRISLRVVPDPKNDNKSWGVKKYHRIGFKAVEYERGVLRVELVRFRHPLTYMTIGGPPALLQRPATPDCPE